MPGVTFKTPPLVEVSLGLFFEPVASMRTAHLGAFWARLSDEYDETEDKPPVGLESAKYQQEWFPLPRVWLIHRRKELLIQLQQDRLYLNWRKINESSEYPRFERIQPEFSKVCLAFHKFVEDCGLGPLRIRQGELTYINHIRRGAGWRNLSEAGNVFDGINLWGDQAKLGSVSGVHWRVTFEKKERAKLALEVRSARLKEDMKVEVLQFELRAASAPGDYLPDGILPWFVTANEEIGEAFVGVTSQRMQKEYWHRVGS